MTIKQKQRLLAFLTDANGNSYYTGSIDGKWGLQSEAAAQKFLADFNGTESDGSAEPESGDFWDGIKYFTREEFACKCGGKHCNGFPVEPVRELVELADDVREHFGAPVYISSGIRCAQHNANVGGVSNSRHLSGKAVDFCVKGKTAAEVLAYVNTLPGVRYAYAIDGNYVHMDVE